MEYNFKQQKIKRVTEQYNGARKDIAAAVGFKQIGEYTANDLIEYVTQKYGAAVSNYPDCMAYLFYQIPQSGEPINVLTEGYVLDKECGGVFVLPALFPQTDPKAKKNGALLIINAADGRPDSWWCGGNAKGYTTIKTELQIFCGKSLQDVLSFYK